MISGRFRPLPDEGERCFPRVHRLLSSIPKSHRLVQLLHLLKKLFLIDICK